LFQGSGGGSSIWQLIGEGRLITVWASRIGNDSGQETTDFIKISKFASLAPNPQRLRFPRLQPKDERLQGTKLFPWIFDRVELAVSNRYPILVEIPYPLLGDPNGLRRVLLGRAIDTEPRAQVVHERWSIDS